MVKFNSKWKPVTIDPNLFSEEIHDLIGIEECTEYDPNIFSKKNSKRALPLDKSQIPNKKKRKTSRSIENKEKTQESRSSFTPSTSGTTSNIGTIEDTVNIPIDVTAWNHFGLAESILRAIGDLGYAEPTQIQSLTLPAAILGRRDILGAAETGSGKTLAFGLPILTGILKMKENQNQANNSVSENGSNSEESDFEDKFQEETGCVKLVNNITTQETSKLKPLYALILTPTRELAMQIKNHLIAVAKYTGINVAVVVGGMAIVKQERILSKGPEIVVATPGRLWELIQQGNLHLSQINNLRFLVIDETDRMLERGHFQELQELLERINLDKEKLKQRQTFVFSATLTLIHELPKYLKNKSLKKKQKTNEMTPAQKLQKMVDLLGMTDPKVVDISEGKGISETLTECKITCNIYEKDYYLFYFLKKYPGRTLIFCNSIGCVKRLASLLNLLNCSPLPLHASMQQRQRLKNLEKFRDNENSVLVATDVAARGLDIPCIDHVLHYQTPRTSESYVHRSGRTARATRQGITVLLIEPNELKNYLKLCKTLGKSEDLPTFPVQENYLNAIKQIIDAARELDKLQLQMKKTNSEKIWFQNAAKEMDILVDDSTRKYDSKTVQSCLKKLEAKKKRLLSLLATHISAKVFYSKYPLFAGAIQGTTEDNTKENSLESMKNAIKNSAKEKTTKRLFRSRKNTEEQLRPAGRVKNERMKK